MLDDIDDCAIGYLTLAGAPFAQKDIDALGSIQQISQYWLPKPNWLPHVYFILFYKPPGGTSLSPFLFLVKSRSIS